MRTPRQKPAQIVLLLALLLSLSAPNPAAGHPAGQDEGFPLSHTLPQTPPVIEPALLHALTDGSGMPIRIITKLRAPELPVNLNQANSPTAMVNALQARHEIAVAPLNSLLAEAQHQGHLLERRDLWIVRSVALTAQADLIRQLMASPAVAALRLDNYRQYVTAQPAVDARVTDVTTTTWGLAQIRAPEVWTTLAISGTGATVAVMDTGVDWLHPALAANYRGNLGKGLFDHNSAWFDAVSGGAYPYDDHGHGTHVAGTAVGRAAGTTGNIGVAPAARWIGVKVFANNGYGYDSWIHAGFQWLLAPGGNPDLAPDVASNSWSSSDGASLEFAEDIERLRQAGIVAVFATGNAGPEPESVGAPASNPGVFAVGASDPDDDVAYFSGRGLSAWGEVKPYVVGPGVHVLSALPGGIYGEKQGTSMATPHVAGLVALLRSADPTLTVAETTRIITQTAVPLTTTVPNNDSGWGRIDAFAAVAAVAHPAIVTGTVKNDNKQTVAGATIIATPLDPFGSPAQTTTASNGKYALALQASVYDLTASAFGHVPQTRRNVVAITDTVKQVDFELAALPTGTVSGRLTISGTTEPPTDTTFIIRALDTPVTTTATVSGTYSFTLPEGVFTVEVRGLGYRVARAPVAVTAGVVTLQDFEVVPAPTLLLVDEGAWYYGSQIRYWEAALDSLDYAYTNHAIKSPPDDTPTYPELSAYDVVLWSSPQGAPGLVNGSDALLSYLWHGGRLLLSGQDVAYFDGGGNSFYPVPQTYLVKQIGAQFAADNAPSRQLTGLGPFSGITVTIEGGSGADNQALPDEVAVAAPDIAGPLWQYTDGGWGGVSASVCVPHRSLFFSFGYEAIADAGQRQDVMARSLDWLTTSPVTVGVTLERTGGPAGIGLPGTQVTHTVAIRHIGYRSPRDPVTLTVKSASWPSAVTPVTVSLPACWPVEATVVVTVPEGTGSNVSDTVTLTVESTLAATSTSLALTTKTPAPVLLVDDDRWYPMEDYYTSALDAAGIPFDVWDNNDNLGGLVGERSPTPDVIQSYPVIVWFTGYDWFAPIYPVEETLLVDYLSGGGRLLLSSQDYLREHPDGPLTKRFGVLSWEEWHNPTSAYGVPDHIAGGTWGPVELEFPFRNFADAIEPVPGAHIVMRGQMGQPIAVAAGDTEARTLLYAFPLEALPLDVRTRSLSRAVDWLSPLGLSHWSITPTVPLAGDRVTHTLVLHNDAASALRATISHTLPVALTPVAETFSPDLHYDAASRAITWTGEVASQAPLTFTWAVSVAGQPGDTIPLTLALGLPDWGITFDRNATVKVSGADLSASGWLSPAWASIRPGALVTLAFELQNTGTVSVTGGSVRLWGTANTTHTASTVVIPVPWGWESTLWEGDLAPAETRVLTLPLRTWAWDEPLRIDAILEDNTGQRWERRRWLNVKPWTVYLPTILRQ